MPPNMKSLMPNHWGWKTEDDNGFVSLHRAMNNLLEDFTRRWEMPTSRPSGQAPMTWSPRLDMVDEGNLLRITVELPGLEQKDIDLSLTGELLAIKGHKVFEQEEKHGTWFHSERSWGDFQRTVPLPFAVDRDHVKASFKHGVLTITLPKTAEAEQSVRKIPVVEA